MDKAQVRSKIEKDLESGDVELYISPIHDGHCYAVIKPHIYPKYQKDSEGKIGRTAFRFDWKISEIEYTKESVLEYFIYTIHKGLKEGKFGIAPVWFKVNEEANQAHG